MNKKIHLILIGTCILGGFFSYSFISLGNGYREYEKLWNYRRLHPELLPSRESIELGTAWHTHTYADTLWIQLIQYIGDNIGNGKFGDYIAPIVTRISEIHPQFMRPYSLALLLAPTPNKDLPSYEKNLAIAGKAYQIGRMGMEKSCDAGKLDTIRSIAIGKELWEQEDLKNPCRDGMLPYYLAAVASNLEDFTAAEAYYKIASMQSDAPEASRFLSILMRSEKGDFHGAAVRFFLIALDGYDEGSCIDPTLSLIRTYRQKLPTTLEEIQHIETIEKRLIAPKDTKNPLAYSSTSCYASTNRGIKALYLGYINAQAQKNPEAKTADDLIRSGILKYIPIPLSHTGFTIKKGETGIWEYRK